MNDQSRNQVVDTTPHVSSGSIGAILGLVVLGGISIAYNLYIESKTESVAMNKLFVLIKEKIYAFLRNGTYIQKLEAHDYLVASKKQSLQILLASSTSKTSNSLGCRLLVVDDITKGWGASLSYYNINYIKDGQPLNVETLNSLKLSKIDLHKYIVSNKIAIPSLTLLGHKQVEAVHGFIQYLVNDDTYLTRMQDDKLIPALNNLASECSMFVRETETMLADTQQIPSFVAINNPKTKSMTKTKKNTYKR
jgi:hypothetical protein